MGIFNSTGIWVNANTGEVNYVKVDKNQNFYTDSSIWLTSYNGDTNQKLEGLENCKKLKHLDLYDYQGANGNNKILDTLHQLTTWIDIVICINNDK